MLPRTTARIVLIALLATAAAATAQTVNRIVLRVNDEIATLHDYERLKAERIAALVRSRLPAERRQELMASVDTDTMSSLFEELLVLSRAAQMGVLPAEAKIDAAIDRNRQAMGIETDEQFEQALAQSGMTREDLREATRKNLTIQEVISREVSSMVEVTEEDLRRYYRANEELFTRPLRLELREIVVLEESGAAPEERRRLAEELRARVLAGELGADEAGELAESGRTTGWVELGWVEPGDLDAQIEAAVLDLQPGEVSEAVPARGGLHLVQVSDRAEAGIRPFKEVEDEIRAREEERVFQEEMARYLRQLERASFIVSNPPPEAAAFRATLSGEAVASDPLLDFDRTPPAPDAEEAPESAGDARPDGDG